MSSRENANVLWFDELHREDVTWLVVNHHH